MARRRNPGFLSSASKSDTTYYVDRRGFGYLKSARAFAQEQANASGKSVMIEQVRYDGKRPKNVWVSPKKTNPVPRGKWISGKVLITRSGQVKFKKGR